MLSFEKEFSRDKSSLIIWFIQGVIEIQQYSFAKIRYTASKQISVLKSEDDIF
uniref:Uncharacterized protein n=1 Tax=Medicago truncatula TaxID=3880 RepID=A2Q1R2_MEDTR|nr:hypothetical protein MtrDRAFT_AC149032g28v2 [Medicago truncatula]